MKHSDSKTMVKSYPAYPSAKVTVTSDKYMETAEALEGVSLVFLDGESILLPEFEQGAIDMLRSRFFGEVEFGCGREWEFATKARAAGVTERLVSLGNAVWGVTGQTVEEMVQAALQQPQPTYAAWEVLYLSSMETH